MSRRVNDSDGVRFLIASLENETDECIIWPYSLFKNGYGQITYNRQKTQASRVSCILAHGPPPDDKPFALHLPVICHNRACINKRHLRWGDRRDNIEDRLLDGTDRQGIKHPLAVLTEKQVKEIFFKPGTQASIAKMYPVSATTIGKIKRGERWGHLTKSLSAREVFDAEYQERKP